MCKPSGHSTNQRFTIVAVRCDTSEETRTQQVRALTTENSPMTVTRYVGNPNRKDVGRRPTSALSVVVNCSPLRQPEDKHLAHDRITLRNVITQYQRKSWRHRFF